MLHLTSQQALQLAADFALTADYVRAANATESQTRAKLLQTASRAAFLRAMRSLGRKKFGLSLAKASVAQCLPLPE
jgi:hypothetical protein